MVTVRLVASHSFGIFTPSSPTSFPVPSESIGGQRVGRSRRSSWTKGAEGPHELSEERGQRESSSPKEREANMTYQMPQHGCFHIPYTHPDIHQKIPDTDCSISILGMGSWRLREAMPLFKCCTARDRAKIQIHICLSPAKSNEIKAGLKRCGKNGMWER